MGNDEIKETKKRKAANQHVHKNQKKPLNNAQNAKNPEKKVKKNHSETPQVIPYLEIEQPTFAELEKQNVKWKASLGVYNSILSRYWGERRGIKESANIKAVKMDDIFGRLPAQYLSAFIGFFCLCPLSTLLLYHQIA